MRLFIGLVLGATLFTGVTTAYYAAFDRESWNDGQFIMVYLAIIPNGCIIGGVTVLVRDQAHREQYRDAALIALSGGVGIAILGVGADVVPATAYAAGLAVWGVRLWSRPQRRAA